MDLLKEIERKKLKTRIIIIIIVTIVIAIATMIILYVKNNRDNKIINAYIMNTNKNAVITINNDMSKIQLFPKTLENIRENNKRIQVSNNEAKFLLNSNYLQENNKIDAQVITTNKYKQINNVVCIEIDISKIKPKEIIEQITVNVEKMNVNSEYVDIYAVNQNNEFIAYRLKQKVTNNLVSTTVSDSTIEKYIIAYVPVNDLVFNYDAINMKKGEEITLTCDINPNATNSQLHAQVKDKDIIEVNANGLIKAINAGTTQLIIQSYKNSVTKIINVVVKEIPSEIQVDKESIELYIDETYETKVTVLPENLENKNVKYSSSDNEVASVNSNGKITGLKKGTAQITITTEETPEISKTIEVKVKEKVSSLTVEPGEVEINETETYKLQPVVLPERLDNKKVKYKSSNEEVAIVDDNGVIYAIKGGDTEITITTDLEPNISVKVKIHVKDLQRPNNIDQNTINKVENNTLV